MKTKQEIKIKITDELHLKAVCDVLESMGYAQFDKIDNPKLVVVHGKTKVYQMVWNDIDRISDFQLVTLTDLLKMRDEAIKEGLKNG